MKDFYELAQRRQSCRNFKDKAVDGELLVRCVKAASLAPSACNSQPWKFVIVTNDEKKGALAKLVQEIGLNIYRRRRRGSAGTDADRRRTLRLEALLRGRRRHGDGLSHS